MLDAFEILTTSGVVLWSRRFAPIRPSVINKFIVDVFVEERGAVATGTGLESDSSRPLYHGEQHTIKWTQVKELGIIFVAVYRSLLHLGWIDKLVENVKTLFVGLYRDQLRKPNTSIIDCHRFDEYFDQQLHELEAFAAAKPSSNQSSAYASAIAQREKAVSGNLGEPPLPPGLLHRGRLANGVPDELPSLIENTPTDSPRNSRPATPSGLPLSIPAKMSRRARKVQNAESSGDEHKVVAARSRQKKGRKWDDSGAAYEDDDGDQQLDYSVRANPSVASTGSTHIGLAEPPEQVELSKWGTSSHGKFVLKDLDDEIHSLLASSGAALDAAQKPANQKSGLVSSGLSTVSSLFRSLVGGKILTKEDLDRPLKGVEEHLLRKNVAREAALRLCQSVQRDLSGTKTGSFESIHARIQSSMEACLTKMLTPTSSLDLLREVDAVTRPSPGTGRVTRPYVMSIVGVNGVGKSTNLSKICFFLLQNQYRVLVVAADTFRSGAVEQLAVHVRNLSELTAREGGCVELYQRGYGKDAATVARDAVAYAATARFDVVLIDTAGRRHNDQRLMSSLEKFAKFAQPDKIIMVGEALVGTDSVAQARNFNAAFGAARRLDGFLISKCDTVGDMVGSIVSLVHATAVPVLFVGVGQHYSDLRGFSVRWAVEKLLSTE